MATQQTTVMSQKLPASGGELAEVHEGQVRDDKDADKEHQGLAGEADLGQHQPADHAGRQERG